ncbi:predicted protein [Naegleria gruberi]|uniref:Predicted protein n=1 Tax=Naegleria gruberi TaxID=5762 RepID=D2V724_NAEGR|nr:uncharacterized protein NAEGRDRAFT_64644 [Naegleria gruberi]EFC47185.1 predicted protein [Naegleria gruberi]|eukprot:XP_002679929.1 predicted protein [Naegleria gruberi strain NEG-M]
MPESQRNQIKDEMMGALDSYLSKDFFYLWEKHVSPMLRSSDPETIKLEFFIRLYFATVPFRHNDKQEQRKYAVEFKQYLDMKGAILSTFFDLLPYYAFPYMPDPSSHPSFASMYQDKWKQDLFDKVKSYLDVTFSRSIEQPYLHSIVNNINTTSSINVANSIAGLGNNDKQGLEQYKKEMGSYMDIVQEKYRELYGLSGDLLKAISGVMKGKKLNKQFLAVVQDNLSSLHIDEILPSMIPRNDHIEDHSATFVSLDYQKLKLFLLKETNNPMIPYVLQALRWRISKSQNTRTKINTLKTMIYYDLFGIVNNEKKILQALLFSKDEMVVEYTLRLINIFSTENVGVVYLTKDLTQNTIIMDLIQILELERSDSIIRQNVVSILQKLSVKSKPQQQMVNNDLIDIVCKILSNPENCGDFTTEYGVSLLMNLCLGKVSIRACERSDIIPVLMDLIQHESPQVRTYVHGTLYSVLSFSNVLKQQARDHGLEDKLKIIRKMSEDELSKQIAYIQDVLSKEETSDEDSNFDEDDEEDLNALLMQDVETDEMVDGELEEESLSWTEDQQIGEELLCNFLASNEQAVEERELLRSAKIE